MMLSIWRNSNAPFKDQLDAWNLVLEIGAADLRLRDEAAARVARTSALPVRRALILKEKEEEEEEDGGEEFEEVEAPQSVYHAEIGKAWEQYLKKHGVVIDYTNPKNFQDSEYIWALYQTFCDEWDKQPHQKIMIRVKKRWTEEEKAALREEIKKEKEEAAKHCFGFKD
jgi:hypothetical protein